MNTRTLLVVDYESDSPDPDTCEPVQLSAIAIDPYKLEFIKDSEFDIVIKPDDIDNKDYLELHEQTINFHAKNMNVSPDKVLEKWRTGVDQKTALNSFLQYIKKYNPKNNSFYTAPIFCGANPDFDIKIFKRYCNKYGITFKNLFWWRDTLDVISISNLWLQWKEDCPRDFKMDTLREYFGIPLAGAHNSLNDVIDEGKLLIRYLQFFKKVSEKTTFAGCFKE